MLRYWLRLLSVIKRVVMEGMTYYNHLRLIATTLGLLKFDRMTLGYNRPSAHAPIFLKRYGTI